MRKPKVIPYGNAVASLVENEISFAGKVWKPTRTLAFVRATLCHSLPAVNANGRALTAATIANSRKSLEHQLCDFEHRLQFYNSENDNICGTLVASEFPPKEEAMAMEKSGKPVPLEILFALWKKVKRTHDVLAELESGSSDWRLSVEIGYDLYASALYDGEKFHHYMDCDSATQELFDKIPPGKIDEKDTALVLGGIDGIVDISGAALTEIPADKGAVIHQAAASKRSANFDPDRVVINTGWASVADYREAVAMRLNEDTAAKAWDTADAPDSLFAFVPPAAKGPDGKKSLRKFPLASVEKKGLDPAILRNALSRLPQSNLTAAEKAATRRKIIAAIRKWNKANPKEKITVSGTAGKAVTPDLSKEDGEMSKELLQFLKTMSEKLKDVDEDSAKALSEMASKIESAKDKEDTEAVIAARIESGDLVPKAKHEEAVEAAKKEGMEKALAEVKAKEEAAKAAKEKAEARLKEIADAKLDPEFTLGKDKTIASVVASIPADEEGDKVFAERMEEWMAWAKKTGQAVASVTDSKDKKPVFTGGSPAAPQEKPGFAFI